MFVYIIRTCAIVLQLYVRNGVFCATRLCKQLAPSEMRMRSHNRLAAAEQNIMWAAVLLPSLLLLLCSVVTSGAPLSSSFYGDTDCGVSGWPVPEPPGGAKLIQVHAIIRSLSRASTL